MIFVFLCLDVWLVLVLLVLFINNNLLFKDSCYIDNEVFSVLLIKFCRLVLIFVEWISGFILFIVLLELGFMWMVVFLVLLECNFCFVDLYSFYLGVKVYIVLVFNDVMLLLVVLLFGDKLMLFVLILVKFCMLKLK